MSKNYETDSIENQTNRERPYFAWWFTGYVVLLCLRVIFAFTPGGCVWCGYLTLSLYFAFVFSLSFSHNFIITFDLNSGVSFLLRGGFKYVT